MCGRYYRIADKQAIVDHFHSPAATDEPFPPGYNIAPGTTQPVIRQGRNTGARELVGTGFEYSPILLPCQCTTANRERSGQASSW